MASRQIGKIVLNRSALFLCDMQEKFRKTIQYFPQVIATSNRLLKAARILDMPVIVTEQYPKGMSTYYRPTDKYPNKPSKYYFKKV